MQSKKTKELEQWIETAHVEEMKDMIETWSDGDFTTYLETLVREKGFKKATVINQSLIQKNFAYQIFSGVKKPGRDKVLQLCFAMKVTIEECNRLLKLAGFSPLYVKVKRDAILLFALQHALSLLEVNEHLQEYQMALLGSFD